MATGGLPSAGETSLKKYDADQASNGYNPEMFSTGKLSSLLCSHCGFVLNNAHYADCGHRFCLACATLLNGKPCRKCAAEGDHYEINVERLTPDNGTNKEISRLSVKCPNGKCKWTGFMRDYEIHEAECKYAVVEEFKQHMGKFLGKIDNTNDRVKRLEDLFSVLFSDVKRLHGKVTGAPIAGSRCQCQDIIGYLRITNPQWTSITSPTEFATPDFYSGRAGYRFKGKALVSPNRQCILTFHILQSDYDKVLSWPINPNIKVVLTGEYKNKIETQSGNITADVDKVPIATSFQFNLQDFKGDLFIKFEVFSLPPSF